jgi:hypothetical protein
VIVLDDDAFDDQAEDLLSDWECGVGQDLRQVGGKHESALGEGLCLFPSLALTLESQHLLSSLSFLLDQGRGTRLEDLDRDGAEEIGVEQALLLSLDVLECSLRVLQGTTERSLSIARALRGPAVELHSHHSKICRTIAASGSSMMKVPPPPVFRARYRYP